MNHITPKAACIWINGRERSGRDELGKMLAATLNNREMPAEYLDNEAIETHLGPGTAEKPDAPLLRAAFLAHLLARNGVTVVLSTTFSNQDLRQRVRLQLHHLVEVAINAPDIHPPVEDPGKAGQVAPDIILNIDREDPDKEQIDEMLARLIKFLEISGHIPARKQEDLTKEESALVQERLKALGYL